jgi:RNA polymerase sigma-70 factor (ECF subfamily)
MPRNDVGDVSGQPATGRREEHPLLTLYDHALPEVYGYLLGRCGSTTVAEDLTSETFLAAVAAAKRDQATYSVAWMIGIARHKLVDHWRRAARESAGLAVIAHQPDDHDDDPWDERLDALRAQQTLDTISPIHRAALVLRYLDDLAVPSVAEELGRTRQATEALISRARSAFRRQYEQRGGDDG